jgi:hypothetical protein
MTNNQGTMTNNQGTMTNNQGTMTYNQGTMTNNQGTMTNNQGTMTYNQGTMTNNQGTMTYNQGTTTNNQGTMTYNQGTTTNNQGTMPYNQGTMTYNQGTMTYNQGTMTYNQGTLSNLRVKVGEVEKLHLHPRLGDSTLQCLRQLLRVPVPVITTNCRSKQVITTATHGLITNNSITTQHSCNNSTACELLCIQIQASSITFFIHVRCALHFVGVKPYLYVPPY